MALKSLDQHSSVMFALNRRKFKLKKRLRLSYKFRFCFVIATFRRILVSFCAYLCRKCNCGPNAWKGGWAQ